MSKVRKKLHASLAVFLFAGSALAGDSTSILTPPNNSEHCS